MTRDEIISILNDWSWDDNFIKFQKPTQKRVFRGAIEIYNAVSENVLNSEIYTKCLKDDIFKLFSDITDEDIFSVEIYSIGNKYFYLGVYINKGTRYLWDD